MSTLLSPAVTEVLDRLQASAETNDDAEVAKALAATDGGREVPAPVELAALLAEAALPVSREVGRFLYMLVRAMRPGLVVEFGTSFGLSTIQLAAAILDGRGGDRVGRVVTTELHEGKAARAVENLAAAGVARVVDVRVGDALSTLDDPGLDGIDFLLLDGWNDLYLSVLRLLEPRLAPGALVVADDVTLFPEQMADYLAHVRDPAAGWLSVSLPLDDGLELSTWIGR